MYERYRYAVYLMLVYMTYHIANDHFLLGPYNKYLMFAWCMLMEYFYWNRAVLDGAIYAWVHPPLRRRVLLHHFGIIETDEVNIV
jgi:hypothetical protein